CSDLPGGPRRDLRRRCGLPPLQIDLWPMGGPGAQRLQQAPVVDTARLRPRVPRPVRDRRRRLQDDLVPLPRSRAGDPLGRPRDRHRVATGRDPAHPLRRRRQRARPRRRRGVRMSRRYLVTGGAGFIGSNFVRTLLIDEPESIVVNLDLLTYAVVPATVAELDEYPNHLFVKGDIRDEGLVDELIQGVDVVVHFAAESHVDRSIAGPGP